MAWMQTELIPHARLVRQLYKKAIRNLRDLNAFDFPQYRYEAIRMRARFDSHEDVPDVREAKRLLHEGQKELEENMHPQPFQHAYSPGGLAYARDPVTPDWLIDNWHPLEKAQYPKYFALRDKRKKEFIERWEQKYGKPDPDQTTHH